MTTLAKSIPGTAPPVDQTSTPCHPCHPKIKAAVGRPATPDPVALPAMPAVLRATRDWDVRAFTVFKHLDQIMTVDPSGRPSLDEGGVRGLVRFAACACNLTLTAGVRLATVRFVVDGFGQAVLPSSQAPDRSASAPITNCRSCTL